MAFPTEVVDPDDPSVLSGVVVGQSWRRMSSVTPALKEVFAKTSAL